MTPHKLTDQDKLAYSALFVFMSLAMADGQLSDEELNLMVSKLNLQERYAGTDMQRLTQLVRKDLNSRKSRGTASELEHHLAEMCHNESDRHQLLRDLEDLIEADGWVRVGEIDFFRQVRLMLL